MTRRLVALMSLVILLSLTAFTLLMSIWERRVMAEVARTVSAVSRATLRELEPDGAGTRSAHRVFVHSERHLTPDGRGVEVETQAQSFEFKEPVGQPETHDKKVTVVVVGSHGTTAEPPADNANVNASVRLLWVQDVRAEPRPDGNLELRISGLRGNPQTAPSPAPGGLTAEPVRQDILLPVPTGEFRDIFARMRSGSLLVFLAALAVGTALSAALATRFTRPVRELDHAIQRLAGGDLDAAVPVRGKDELGRLAQTFNDMARELRSARDRSRDLTRREKLSALGRLAAGVAHDVRNPLHAIGLTLTDLADSCRPDDPARRADFERSLAVVRGEIQRLDRRVENFLRFARSERKELVPTDLPELLRETATLVAGEAERRKVTITLAVEGEPAAVNADRESVRAAILNLVLNSLEAMPEGGALNLTASAADAAVRIEISDTGRGIPEADHERVFEFAWTTREDGSGLGLAMVHQVVVEEHGGQVELASQPGQGTRVRMTLPLAAGAPA